MHIENGDSHREPVLVVGRKCLYPYADSCRSPAREQPTDCAASRFKGNHRSVTILLYIAASPLELSGQSSTREKCGNTR